MFVHNDNYHVAIVANSANLIVLLDNMITTLAECQTVSPKTEEMLNNTFDAIDDQITTI